MEEKIDFNDWFDIYDGRHMEAYNHLRTNGHWPEGFIPDNVKQKINWYFNLIYKMAEAFADNYNCSNI